jgi:hypothetical protein
MEMPRLGSLEPGELRPKNHTIAGSFRFVISGL